MAYLRARRSIKLAELHPTSHFNMSSSPTQTYSSTPKKSRPA
jgi:hypothetical protein